MKHTALILIISLLIISCSDEDKTVTLTGEIINPTEEMVWITINDSTQLSTRLDENNKFIFELNILEANKYRFDHGGHTFVFLKPGSSLHLSLDTKYFDGTISYSGTDIEENEYLKKRILISEGLQANRFNIPNLNESEFDSLIANTLGVWEKLLLDLKNIEDEQYTRFREAELKEINKINTIASDYYQSMKLLTPGNEAIDYNLQTNPNLFDSFLVIDPSLWWNDKQCVKSTKGFFENNKNLNKRLFISLSNEKNMGVYPFIGELDKYAPNEAISTIQISGRNTAY